MRRCHETLTGRFPHFPSSFRLMSLSPRLTSLCLSYPGFFCFGESHLHHRVHLLTTSAPKVLPLHVYSFYRSVVFFQIVLPYCFPLSCFVPCASWFIPSFSLSSPLFVLFSLVPPYTPNSECAGGLSMLLSSLYTGHPSAGTVARQWGLYSRFVLP